MKTTRQVLKTPLVWNKLTARDYTWSVEVDKVYEMSPTFLTNNKHNNCVVLYWFLRQSELILSLHSMALWFLMVPSFCSVLEIQIMFLTFNYCFCFILSSWTFFCVCVCGGGGGGGVCVLGSVGGLSLYVLFFFVNILLWRVINVKCCEEFPLRQDLCSLEILNCMYLRAAVKSSMMLFSF